MKLLTRLEERTGLRWRVSALLLAGMMVGAGLVLVFESVAAVEGQALGKALLSTGTALILVWFLWPPRQKSSESSESCESPCTPG